MFTIRPAQSNDCTTLQQLYAASLASAEWLPANIRQQAHNLAQDSQGELLHLVSASDGTLLGFIAVQIEGSFVHHLFIAPAAKGQGVGRALLASIQNLMPQPWHLKCVRANNAAMGFYLHLGWREVDSGVSAHGDYALLAWRSANLADDKTP